MKRTAMVLGLFVVLLGGCANRKYTMQPSAPSAQAVGAAASEAPAGFPAAAGYPALPVAADMVAPPSTPVASGAARASTAPAGAGLLTAGVWDDNRNFDFWKPYQAGFVREYGSDFAMFSADELSDASRAFAQGRGPKTELDVQLVLDTTGSMGDELSYLQTELDAIVGQLHAKLPSVTPRWSLVVYRDKGDDYVTQRVDFTTDTNGFRKSLRAQSAGGGGDVPEAVVEGLREGLHQKWRRDRNVAKVAFWVADAPAHPGQGHELASVLRQAKDDGVHIYPIASSDTSPEAEYQMRSAAQMTGGRYVFLTNDSGVGNDHAEPHIPCYSVTRLDSAMVRMIENEMTGRHVEPEGNEVIRAVGKPNAEGKCALPSGALVAAF